MHCPDEKALLCGDATLWWAGRRPSAPWTCSRLTLPTGACPSFSRGCLAHRCRQLSPAQRLRSYHPKRQGMHCSHVRWLACCLILTHTLGCGTRARARQVAIFTRLLNHKRVQRRGRDSLSAWHSATRVAVRCRAVLKAWVNRNDERQLLRAHATWRQHLARCRVLRRVLLRLAARTKFAAFAGWTARARDAVRIRRVCHRSLVVASCLSIGVFSSFRLESPSPIRARELRAESLNPAG